MQCFKCTDVNFQWRQMYIYIMFISAEVCFEFCLLVLNLFQLNIFTEKPTKMLKQWYLLLFGVELSPDWSQLWIQWTKETVVGGFSWICLILRCGLRWKRQWGEEESVKSARWRSRNAIGRERGISGEGRWVYIKFNYFKYFLVKWQQFLRKFHQLWTQNIGGHTLYFFNKTSSSPQLLSEEGQVKKSC